MEGHSINNNVGVTGRLLVGQGAEFHFILRGMHKEYQSTTPNLSFVPDIMTLGDLTMWVSVSLAAQWKQLSQFLMGLVEGRGKRNAQYHIKSSWQLESALFPFWGSHGTASHVLVPFLAATKYPTRSSLREGGFNVSFEGTARHRERVMASGA